ncbi:MAG TPA: DUF1810 domain-containing protein [Tepidisphaeraceae bacterium]|nr:DUF1810 domain-containing protein [Tepidisphaeraceae bacterium]
MPDHPDPFDLARFVDAQSDGVYETALAELRAGQKRSHWMWFIFPQLRGLGSSSMAQHYAIQSRDEAAAYLAHPLLGHRLTECAEALLAVEGRTALQILGSPDDLKLKSCATLFAAVAPAGSVFDQLLDKYYARERDRRTLDLLPAR